MRDRIRFLVVTGVAGALLSACGVLPAPGTGTTEPSPTPTSRPTLPPRPRVIDLTGVDACTLLTPQQQHQLGIDRPPKRSSDTDRYGNTYCDYGRSLRSPRFTYTVKAVTQEDATVYLANERNSVSHIASAAGFPAVVSHLPSDTTGCFTLVSTKEGQYLSVQYGESMGADDPPEVVCEKARGAAEMAALTLLTQR